MSAVAIVGIALALPDAAGLDDLHANLAAARCSVRAVSRSRRWFADATDDDSYPMAALERIDLFDHELFGISSHEALGIDPQHRLALELAWTAIGDAGRRPTSLAGSRTGVFLSAPRAEYASQFSGSITPSRMVGGLPAAIAGRVSYHLSFHGPSIVVDTGCSGSLVAVGLAVDALRSGRCDYALAGGVSLHVAMPTSDQLRAFAEIMSADGICRAFDRSSAGTADGEGGVVLLLKRLEDALRDEDGIHAIVRAVATNHNGSRSVGLVAPSVEAQTELLLSAWAEAGVTGPDISFVEGHGSGTRVGDAIELTALNRALLAGGRSEGDPVPIASVKTNLGHLDHASGVLGLAKAVAGLEHRVVYPSLHFSEMNEDLDGASQRVVVAQETASLDEARLIAGVSSFSLTGTNAHAVLESPPARVTVADKGDRPLMVKLSARSPESLRAFAGLVASRIRDTQRCLVDVVGTLNAGREDYAYRWASTVRSTEDLLGALDSLANGLAEISSAERRPVVFVVPESAFEERDDLHRLEHAANLQCSLDHEDITSRHRCGLAALRVLGVNGTSTITERRPPQSGSESVEFDVDALERAVHALAALSPLYFVLGAPGSPLADHVAELTSPADLVYLFGSACPTDALATAYVRGATIDWDAHVAPWRSMRVSLPSQPFMQSRVWPERSIERRALSGSLTRVSGIERAVIDAAVRRVVGTVLQADDLGASPNYFDLGGNSVLGLEVIDRLADELGVQISLPDLFEYPDLADLVDRIEGLSATGGSDARVQPIAPGRRTRTRLTFGQESLWFLDRLDPGNGVYNLTIDMRMRGTLDRHALGAAINGLVARHEVLRSRYVEDELGVHAVFDPPTSVPIVEHVLDEGGGDSRIEALRQLVESIALEPYDLARGPLYRAALVQLGDDDHLIVFGTHHSVDDGWSPAIVNRELRELYAAHLAGRDALLPPLPIQYGDFAEWQRGALTDELLETKLCFWEEYLEGASATEVQPDFVRPPVFSGIGGHHYFKITPSQLSGLRRIAQQERASMFMATLAVFESALSLYTGSQDLVVGTITAGRNRPETRELIGYFNNMVPLRTDASGAPSYREMLRRVRRSFLDTVDHHDLPFSLLVQRMRPIRDLSRHPIFQIGFTYQTIPRLGDGLQGLSRDRSEDERVLRGVAPNRSPWDLDLIIWDLESESDFLAVIEYSSDLYEEDTIARFADLFSRLLDAALASPDEPLGGLDVIGDDREMGVLLDLGRGRPEGTPVWLGSDRTALHPIMEIARFDPRRSAVVATDGTSASYGELTDRARGISRALRRLDLAGQSVALLLPRDTTLVASMLGCWLAGKPYTVLDPTYPPSMVHAMMDGAGVDVVLASSSACEEMACFGRHVLNVDSLGSVAPDGADTLPDVDGSAYVVFTSGTTGAHKPTLLSHRALQPFMERWSSLSGEHGLRYLSMAGASFDVFSGDVIRALTSGGCLVLARREEIADPQGLIDVLRTMRVEAVELLPPQLRAELVASLRESNETLDLRLVMNGLEVWHRDEVGETKRVLAPRGSIINVFGVTEAGIDSTLALASASLESRQKVVPIGRPYPGVSTYVVAPDLELSPRSGVGELCIGGAGLATGYIGMGRLTAERFIPDPYAGEHGARMYRTGDRVRWNKDGELEFLGRMDDQIKLHGHRIEPAEVEGALRRHPDIGSALVRVDDLEGRSALIAYLVPGSSGRRVPVSELRDSMRDVVPDHLIPSRFIWIDSIPVTSNGKVDLRRLRASLTSVDRSELVAPRDLAELAVAEVYRDVLDVAAISIKDDFFALGGHSLLAIRALTALEQRTGVHLPLSTLFRRSTVEDLASELRGGGDDGPESTVVPLRDGPEARATLVLAHPSGGSVFCYYDVARSLRPSRSVVALQAVGLQGCEAPLATVEEMVDRFASDLSERGLRGPLIVGGWSMGGTLAYELAGRLRDSDIDVPVVVLIDSEPTVSDVDQLPEDDVALLAHLLVTNRDFVLEGSGLGARFDPRERLRRAVATAADSGQLPPGVGVEQVERLLAVLRANEVALRSYAARPYDGDVLLLRTEDGPNPRRNQDRTLGWGDLVDRLQVVTVQGSHFSVVPREYDDVATKLSAALAERGM